MANSAQANFIAVKKIYGIRIPGKLWKTKSKYAIFIGFNHLKNRNV
jgi:hypothetical protein